MAESLKQQKERIKLEQEYQAALKMSKSLSSEITDDINSQVDYRTALGQKMKEFNNDLSSQVSGLQSSADITKAIQSMEYEKDKIASSYFGKNKAIGDAKQAALETAIEALRVEESHLQATEQVNSKAQEFSKSIGSGLDNMVSKMGSVPVLGGLISSMASKASSSIKDKLGKAATNFTVNFREGLKKTGTSLGGLQNALKKGASGFGIFKVVAMGAILGLLGALALGIHAMEQLGKATIAFREETGLLRGAMDGMESKVNSAAGATFGMTGDLAEGAKLAGQMVNAFGGVENLSKGVLVNATKLAAGLGLSMDAIGGVNKLFQNAFGHSEDLAQMMVNTTVEAATLAGVPANKVLKDMAESSEEVYTFFKGSPQTLQKAAIQAAKLGTSIKQAAGVSKGLLDFESSINNELEASAILGTNINFNQARQLAAQGDIVGAQQATIKEVSKLGDLSKMNYYQQEALAKAAGMPIGDMINQQRLQKKFGSLKGEELAAAQEMINKGKDISNMSKEDIKKALARKKVENQRTTAMEGLKRTMQGLALQFSSIFLPLAQGLISFIRSKPVMEKIKGVIEGIRAKTEQLGKWFTANKGSIGDFFSGMGDGFTAIKEAAKTMWDAVKPALDWIGNKLGGLSGEDGESPGGVGKKVVLLGAAFMGLKLAFPLIKMLGGGIFGLGKKLLGVGSAATQTASSSGGFLKTIGNGIKSIGQGIGGAVKSLSSGLGSALKSIASGMGSAMKSIGSGIGGLISGISKGIGSALGAIGKGMGAFLRGLSGGLTALANPAALIGLAAITLAFIGMAAALRIMAPALEPLGNMFKSIFEGIASIVVPVIEILVNGFTTLADVIGGVILGIMREFGSIVATLGETFVSIAAIIGDTVLGIFDSVGATLAMIVENSDKAGQIGAMALAIGALGAALAGFGVGAGVGGAVSGFGNLIGSVTNGIASVVSGEKAEPTGPMAILSRLLEFGPSIGTFSSQLVTSIENFDLFTTRIESMASPITVLTQAMNDFASSMSLVVSTSKALAESNVGDVTGMAGATTGKGFLKSGKSTLPDTITQLAASIQGMEMSGGDDKAMLKKLESIRKAIIVGTVLEMDGVAVTSQISKYAEAQGRVNMASRFIS
tara:strand:+ start:1329 stop:4694 length:3366 start_codon:yes stop_codon:yes gene_type:complete